jgi:hypothetical protein
VSVNNKILAIYLPQFHCIKENDDWWGKGFTEWSNTKKSKPLFAGHRQPRTPQDGNYYDLTENGVLEAQAALAKSKGIDGFCFYHYWFNGKRVLEAPTELLLKKKNIDIEFILSWANEPWTRSWDGKNKDVLLEQTYGDEDDWHKHYKCLRRYFLDSRYIKIDNRPVFVIYRTNSFEGCEDMITFWNECARKDGFNGVYIVETLNSFQQKPSLEKSEAAFEFEPMFTLRHSAGIFFNFKRAINKALGKLDVVSYKDVTRFILKKDIAYEGKEKFFSCFVGWDNAARKGKKGLVMNDSSPEHFKFQFENQYKKMRKRENSILFINAWNEWAEGAYLEADEEHGESYLNVIKKIVKGK